MVLIGVDKDQARVEGSEYGASESAYRTDTILLARVDPTEKQVTLVSIHRDTLIDFGSYGKQKINAAYSIGAERQEAGEQGVRLLHRRDHLQVCRRAHRPLCRD